MKRKSLILVVSIIMCLSACGNKEEEDGIKSVQVGDTTTASSHQNTSSLLDKDGNQTTYKVDKVNEGNEDDGSGAPINPNNTLEDVPEAEVVEKTIIGTWVSDNGDTFQFTERVVENLESGLDGETGVGGETGGNGEVEGQTVIEVTGYISETGASIYGTATTDNETYIEISALDLSAAVEYEDVEQEVTLEDGTVETEIIQVEKVREPEVTRYTISKFDYENAEGGADGKMELDLHSDKGDIRLHRVFVGSQLISNGAIEVEVETLPSETASDETVTVAE